MWDLKWGGAIPARVWAGRSPQEDPEEDPEKLLQVVQDDLSSIRKATKRRKLKECRILMSHATQIREFNRSVGELQYSIQAIQGTVSR